MFNIGPKMIMSMCSNPATYLRGLSYYNSGRVTGVTLNKRRTHVSAYVHGSEYYFVSIELSPDGDICGCSCECPAYLQYGGSCKHITALLFYLMNSKKNPPHRSLQGRGDVVPGRSEEIISFFENRAYAAPSVPVDIEVTLEVSSMLSMRSRRIWFATLRVGTGRLYVVRDMKAFLQGVRKGYVMEFGKGFTYDPVHNYFRDEDKELMDFLCSLYDAQITAEDVRGESSGLILDRRALIPPLSMGRFLKAVKGRDLKVSIMGDDYEHVNIVDADAPVGFRLSGSDGGMVLDVDIPKGFYPLTPDMEHVFLAGTIYNTSRAQQENLAPFYSAAKDTGCKSIRFSKSDGERLVSFVMPGVKKAGALEVDKGIEDALYRMPLQAEAYLDREGSRITASLKFCYGEISIDPFDEKDLEMDGHIVVRDYEKERMILDIIGAAGFKIIKPTVYLDDDDGIYAFITEYIPQLQRLCTVYYSDAFKSIRIYDSPSYVSSVKLGEDSDLLEFSFSIDGIDRDSLPGIFASIKSKKKYHRLHDGSYLPLDSDELQSIADRFEDIGIKDEQLGSEAIDLPKFKAMYLDQEMNGFKSVRIERSLAFQRLISSIREPSEADFPVPESLKGIMRAYQVNGFKWLKTLASYNLGGILADDMGLGKTLQAIAFLLSERESVSLPSIVVCPTSIMYNWKSEIERFAPSLKALLIIGGRHEREELIKSIPDFDIVITSYPLIRKDIQSYRRTRFGYCILDEAQYIKNAGSLNSRSVKEIRAKGYFALTGTPIENNLSELWSIFDFLMPGYLLSYKRFVEKYEKPIVSKNDEGALKDLNRHVKPFILRRLKRDVLKELPPKIESVIAADLTEGQKKVYLAYLEQIKGKIEEEIRDKGFERSHIQILAGLTRLRQICCDPSLFIEGYRGGSGKMDLLLELVGELRDGGHRVLLFSQFTGALKLIREALEPMRISNFYLDGATKAEDRISMVKSFNEGFRDVFLISLRAGGTGLNLTGADTVIHFDPWWNPAVEEQAADRAHRIGQSSTVQVMRLVCRGTIEEKILALQQKKKGLVDSVLQSGETFISKMTEEDIKELFRV